MRPPSISYPVLLADVGGTNCRLSLVGDADCAHKPLARIGTGSYPTVEAAFAAVIADLPEKPRSAVIAVAGPLEGRQAQLTNAVWHFDGPRIAGALGLAQGLMVNDFEALSASLAVLAPSDLMTLVEGEPEPEGVKLVLGPGTGFGAAGLLMRGERGVLIPTEAGHIGIGPEDQTEQKIWPALSEGIPRLTVEHLLSGDGLVRLHKAVARTSGMLEAEVSAADVSRLAHDGDPAALMAVVCFWRLLARVAGDLALVFKATGGVFIAGGIAPHLLPLADKAAIRTAFAEKPPMEDLARRFALHVITATDAAEQGLAAIAANLHRFGLDDPKRLWFWLRAFPFSIASGPRAAHSFDPGPARARGLHGRHPPCPAGCRHSGGACGPELHAQRYPALDGGRRHLLRGLGLHHVHASQDLFGREGASRLFLKRRLARIVPLYWAMTTLLLLVGLMVPAVLNSGTPNLRQILGSYLFWPVVSTQGMVQPAYSLGWTLNYEMLFYVLFAAGLMLPRRWTLPAVAFVLALLVAAESLKGPLLLPFGFWGQPIVLEFAAGMGIAVLRQKGLRLHGALRIAVAMVGAALLVAAAHFPGADGAWSSVLWRGSAAALLMLAAGCGREGIMPLPPVKALAAVGDASYALYLVHPFVIRGMREVMLRLGLYSPALYIALALVGSVVAALLLYRFFEKPATRLARRWLGS